MSLNNFNRRLKLRESTFMFLKFKKVVLHIDFKIFSACYYVSHHSNL